jgi:restriction system protein
MARSFLSAMKKISQDMERAARANDREQQRRLRMQLQAARETERAAIAEDKERKRLYVEARVAEVFAKNEEINQTILGLEKLLLDGLEKKCLVDFEAMLIKPSVPDIDYGDLLHPTSPPNKSRFCENPPGFLIKWFPGVKSRYEARKEKLDIAYAKVMAEYELQEQQRNHSIEQKKQEHERAVEQANIKAEQYNQTVREWENAYKAGGAEAVAEYFITALKNSTYPEDFPKIAKVFFSLESKQLVVEYELPTLDQIIPEIKSYKYTKITDSISSTSRPEAQRRMLYASVIAQVTLRSLHELFKANNCNHFETLTFSGYVSTIAPGTGQPIRPCIITVRTTQDIFAQLELSQVEPTACLKTLNASFSKSPAELAPVRPILELNMVDPRFIQEEDVLSTLDQRPNLMDLTPAEFETLITNLFQKMGLDTKLTQASRDGGVDCVAFDPRPIFGGKVVIQAKRYKNTVGVSAVRDLFGTMQNEGASKGILVTTSGYGKAAFDFANGKPIELLDGGNLLYLLTQHAQLEARIVMPEEQYG